MKHVKHCPADIDFAISVRLVGSLVHAKPDCIGYLARRAQGCDSTHMLMADRRPG